MKNKINDIEYCKGLKKFLILIIIVAAFYAVICLFQFIQLSGAPENSFNAIEISPSLKISNSNNSTSITVPYWAILDFKPMGSYSLKSMQLVTIVLWLALTLLPYFMILLGLIKVLNNILNTRTPFETENINWMKRIAYIQIYLALILKPLWILLMSILVHNQINISLRINTSDISYLVSGIVLLIFANVFDYGLYLQNEYDETL